MRRMIRRREGEEKNEENWVSEEKKDEEKRRRREGEEKDEEKWGFRRKEG